MESTEESETEQPFLPTVVEIANDKVYMCDNITYGNIQITLNLDVW
jgi:hypothetical protein